MPCRAFLFLDAVLAALQSGRANGVVMPCRAFLFLDPEIQDLVARGVLPVVMPCRAFLFLDESLWWDYALTYDGW